MSGEPKIVELSKMSNLTYEKEENQPPEDWEEFQNSTHFNKGRFGHFAIVFKNKHDNTFVVANRGTRPSKLIDWFNDGQIVFSAESYSAQEAFKYFKYVHKVIESKVGKNFKIYTTGHSKGAFESSYITKEIMDDKEEGIRYPNYIGSIGFNGPGFGAFRNIDNPEQYPHLCIDRISDAVSTTMMSKIGRQIILPNKGLKAQIISNHSITHKNDLLTSYTELGNIEINKESIFNLSQKDIDSKAAYSRMLLSNFLNKSKLPKDEKVEMLKRVHGIRDHAWTRDVVKKAITKEKNNL